MHRRPPTGLAAKDRIGYGGRPVQDPTNKRRDVPRSKSRVRPAVSSQRPPIRLRHLLAVTPFEAGQPRPPTCASRASDMSDPIDARARGFPATKTRPGVPARDAPTHYDA